jgi:hypothetical protein
MGVAIAPATAVGGEGLPGLKEVTGVYVRSFSHGDGESGEGCRHSAGRRDHHRRRQAGGPREHAPAHHPRAQAGETVTLEVMRFGERRAFKVKLVEAPDASQVASARRAGVDPAGERGPPVRQARYHRRAGVPALVTRARVAEPYRRGLLVSEVKVTGPAYRRVDADNTISYRCSTPARARELHTPADLESVLSGSRRATS